MRDKPIFKFRWLALLFLALGLISVLNFKPKPSVTQQVLPGQWQQIPDNWSFSTYDDFKRQAVLTKNEPKLTGGNFVFVSGFDIKKREAMVLDFKNTSAIGAFHHYLLTDQGQLLNAFEGGIQINAQNPFLMRHGRIFELPEGRYKLITLLQSPYFIAKPAPYIDTLKSYQQQIKWGDLIGLLSLGVLLSLAIYYGILAFVRRQLTELTYTIFIAMNLLFNGMTMLILPDMFSVHWYYLVGAPILLSNIAYIIFVMSLLEIKPDTHPNLYTAGKYMLYTLGLFLLAATIFHHWVLELARYGVGLILAYGFAAGVLRAREGFDIAKMYLFAIVAFVIVGSFTISNKDLDGVFTIYIEHVGLLAVTIEVLLIGLVLGFQFAELHREKDRNLRLVQHSLKIAHSDALTGLPNRFALDQRLLKLTETGTLTFIDMDNLKLYNDNYGHSKGDALLKSFATHMQAQLGDIGVLHRIGGDEFAVVSDTADDNLIEVCINQAIIAMQKDGFESSGASHGTVNRFEAADINALKEMADAKMYQHKRFRKEITRLNY